MAVGGFRAKLSCAACQRGGPAARSAHPGSIQRLASHEPPSSGHLTSNQAAPLGRPAGITSAQPHQPPDPDAGRATSQARVAAARALPGASARRPFLRISHTRDAKCKRCGCETVLSWCFRHLAAIQIRHGRPLPIKPLMTNVELYAHPSHRAYTRANGPARSVIKSLPRTGRGVTPWPSR
jgi:hypothetical protein